jgi:hypothetical protein
VPEENYFAAGRFIDELTPKEGSIHGIYNITVRPEQKIKFSDRKIALEEIKKILDPISLSYSETIKTGYGQNTRKAKNTVVWGFEQYGLFVKHQGFIVETIWIGDSPGFSQDKHGKHLSKAIFTISKTYALILIDWNKEIVCRIRSEDDVKEYLYQNLSFDYY